MRISHRKEIRKLTFRPGVSFRRIKRRANARNVSGQFTLSTQLIKLKLSCNTLYRRSTTVSLQNYPFIQSKLEPGVWCKNKSANKRSWVFTPIQSISRKKYTSLPLTSFGLAGGTFISSTNNKFRPKLRPTAFRVQFYDFYRVCVSNYCFRIFVSVKSVTRFKSKWFSIQISSSPEYCQRKLGRTKRSRSAAYSHLLTCSIKAI